MNLTTHDYKYHQIKKLKRTITEKDQSSTIPEKHASSSYKQNENTISNNCIDDIPSLVT